MNKNTGIKVLIIVLALIVAGGAVIFAFRDKIFKEKKSSDKKDKSTSSSEVSSDEQREAIPIDFDLDYASMVDLAEYKNVELKEKDVDEQYDAAIKNALSSYASYEKIKEGKVKDGDTVYIYYVGKVDGEAFEGGTYTKEQSEEGYPLTIGSGSFIDDFEQQLIGVKVGKTVDVEVTFPDEYQSEELQGKDAVFTVDVLAIQGDQKFPELTDEFVKKNFKDQYKDADDMKDSIRKTTISDMAWNKVCEESEIKEYPDDLVKGMENQLYMTSVSYLASQGSNLEDYLKSQDSTMEDFQADLEATAKSYVDRTIIVFAIAQNEGIEVDDDEYKNQLQEYIDSYAAQDESIKDEETLNAYFEKNYASFASDIVKQDVLTTQVKDFVVENASEK